LFSLSFFLVSILLNQIPINSHVSQFLRHFKKEKLVLNQYVALAGTALTYVSIGTRRRSGRGVALEPGATSERRVNAVVAALPNILALAVASFVIDVGGGCRSSHGGGSEEDDGSEELHVEKRWWKYLQRSLSARVGVVDLICWLLVVVIVGGLKGVFRDWETYSSYTCCKIPRIV
jgi:hypothetical protein